MKKFFFLTLLILTFLSPQNFVFGADTTKYYFAWQDVAGGYKTEVTIIGKDACNAERNSGQYKITSSCYTPSHQADIDTFNKTAGNYPFTWQMDNVISKQTRKGGGDTVIKCGLDRSGKIIDLTPAQLASWTNTKLCTDLRGVADPYYFNWQDNTTKLKYEISFVNKADCEKEQVDKKYTNGTACYTPSQQSTISTYNQAQVVDPKKEPNEFNPDYTLLAPIGSVTTIGENTGSKIGDYLNIILLVAIGLCGALAVIMIVIRGIQYMGDESVFGKTEAKHHIMQAIFGLLLALGAYAILNTINPNLVGGSLTFNQVDIELEGDVNAPVSVNKTDTKSLGIICNGGGKAQIPTIAKSFNGKMTYSQDIPKGKAGPNNTIKLDCSGFVNYVLSCADIDNSKINSGTSIIFSNAEKVLSMSDTQVNGKDLQYGDLIGWRPQDDKKGNGHVMIYIGNGQVADSHSPRNLAGKAYGSFASTKYKNRITYIKRM